MSTANTIDVDAEGTTAAGINDILRTLGHATLPLSLPSDDLSSWSIPELQGEVRRLRAEVWRLNPGFLTLGGPASGGGELVVPGEEGEQEPVEEGEEEHGAEAVVRAIRNLQSNSALSGGTDILAGGKAEDGHSAMKPGRTRTPGRGRKRPRVTLDRDVETGKRMEKGRKTELSKLLRARMRAAMSISETDPLPDPLEAADGQVVIPDWTNAGEEKGHMWVDNIAMALYNDAMAGNLPSVPPEDVDYEVIKNTARTAFHNFARKYIVENDPTKAEKKNLQAKGRRRWARKDLKQKRRIKASQDASFGDAIPAGALQLDYMSSEYSSLAEDSDGDDLAADGGSREEVLQGRKAEWDAKVLALPVEAEGDGSKGWADGLGAKVLEVRTPRWRSDQLNALYTRLDSIASARTSQRLNPSLIDTAGGVRPGHVAPSHHRFTMPPSLQRRGTGSKRKENPSGGDESWMWKSGIVGVWTPLPPRPMPNEELVEVEGVISGDIWDTYPAL